jgi:hypothetical protein
MPCLNDDGYDGTSSLRNELARKDAILCAVFSELERTPDPQFKTALGRVYNNADWMEAGVTLRWVAQWWEDHKKEDIRRRNREATERALNEQKEAALAKLTPKERALLGISHLKK